MKSKQELVFATNNPNKIAEVNRQLGDRYNFLSLADIGCTEEVPETNPTIPGNAIQKARYVYEKYGHDCFSEDTGLEIDALNGEPGVLTARYAGPERSATANMRKVLDQLSAGEVRTARFHTVICLIIDGKEYLFTGYSEGTISEEMRGSEGFGYDPIFIPNDETQTFAEMGFERKKMYSHRARAVKKLVDYLGKS